MIIDSHVHLSKVPQKRSPGGLDRLLNEYMRPQGVDKVVCLGLQEPAGPNQYSISEVLELNKKHGDKFIPFCGVDWRYDPDKVDKVQKYVGMGCKAVGELNHRLVADDTRILPIYKVCGELGVPVLIHMESSLYNLNLVGFRRVLAEFTETTFIAHGPGFWRHISGDPYPKTVKYVRTWGRGTVGYTSDGGIELGAVGYPFEGYPWGPVEQGGEVQKILKQYPNVYCDLSAFSGMGALQRDIFHAREFLEEFKDRCMYGTDFPADNLLDSETFGVDGVLLNYLRCLRLNKDTWEKVTHENLEKICKLSN